MSHYSLQHGISLEDGLTNTFIIAGTKALKWRCFTIHTQYLALPESDPLLSTYSKLLEQGFLSTWQRASPVVLRSGDDSPPKAQRELWIFWYGNEPSSIRELIHPDLKENIEVTRDDDFKYEYKTVFYKALHAAIERRLLKQKFVRLDKWFVKPQEVDDFGLRRENLSFKFSFFLHGDSYVCASVNTTRHTAIRRITAEHVSWAATMRPKVCHVMLAPYCIRAVLTGTSFKTTDHDGLLKLLEEWNRFFPIVFSVDDIAALPPAVEVQVGGVTMCYPSWMVIISKEDDPLPWEKSSNDTQRDYPSHESGCEQVGISPCQLSAFEALTASWKESSTRLPLHNSEQSDASVLLNFMDATEVLSLPCRCCHKRPLQMFNRKEKYARLHCGRFHININSSDTGHLVEQNNLVKVEPATNLAPAGTTETGNDESKDSSRDYRSAGVKPLFSPGLIGNTLISSNNEQPQPFTDESHDVTPVAVNPNFPPNIVYPGRHRIPELCSPNNNDYQIDAREKENLICNPPSLLDRLYAHPMLADCQSVIHDPDYRGIFNENISDDDTESSVYDFNEVIDPHQMAVSMGQKKKRNRKNSSSKAPGSTLRKPHRKRTKVKNEPDAGESLNGSPPKSKQAKFSPSVTITSGLDVLQNKQDFVDNCFTDSSDDEDRIADGTMATNSPRNDEIPQPDSVELARMFPTPPSNAPVDGATGLNCVSSPGEAKLSNSYNQQLSHQFGGASDSCYNHVLAAAGLETTTTVHHNPDSHVPSGSQQVSPSLPPEELCPEDDWKTIVKIEQKAIYEDSPSYCPLVDMHRLELEDARVPPIWHHIVPVQQDKSYQECSQGTFGGAFGSSTAFTPGGSALDESIGSYANPSSQIAFPDSCRSVEMTPRSVLSNCHSPATPNPYTPAPQSVTTDINSPYSVRTPFSNYQQGTPRYGPGSAAARTGFHNGPHSVCNLGEAHSLIVNLYLSDTLLNIFTDTNFDSCVLCNCNVSIKGNDASLHLQGSSLAAQTDRGQSPCVCGFMAVRNRHLAAGAGLFGEDELDLVDKLSYSRTTKSLLSSVDSLSFMSVLRHQLSNPFELSPKWDFGSVLRPRMRNEFLSKSDDNRTQREKDGLACLSEALQFARLFVDSPASASAMDKDRARFHNWVYKRDTTFARAGRKHCRATSMALHGLARELREVNLGFVLDSSAQKLEGPLTWSQFYKQSECNLQGLKPLPVPTLLVGAPERQVTSVTPFALACWEKLFLKPFSGPRNVQYVAVCPDDSSLVHATSEFLKELSSVYQNCHLGSHVPANFPEDRKFSSRGIIKLGKTKNELSNLLYGPSDPEVPNIPAGEWWSTFSKAGNISEKLMEFANQCQTDLPGLLQSVSLEIPAIPTAPPMSTAANPGSIPVKTKSSSVQQHIKEECKEEYKGPPQLSPMHPPSNYPLANGHLESLSPVKDSGSSDDSLSSNDVHNQTLVIYILDPFSFTAFSHKSQSTIASALAFIKCFQQILDSSLPKDIRGNVVLELLPLSSLACVTRWREPSMTQRLLRSYAFSVYSKCTSNRLMYVPCKTLTKFGPAADQAEGVHKYGYRPEKFTPPFILNPPKIPNERMGLNNDFSQSKDLALTGFGTDSRTLFVSYCLSHDHRWILVCCTDLAGEILHTQTINIDSPHASNKKRPNERRAGLEKVWEFVLTVISNSALQWRIVIGRLGRLGHGEVKDWQMMLSKSSLSRYSQSLKANCGICRLQGNASTASIVSTCLISFESASHLQVLHDHSKEEKKTSTGSSSSNHPHAALGNVSCKDVSSTHVLVVPISANTQQVPDQIDTSEMVSLDDLFNVDDGDDITQIMNDISETTDNANDNNPGGGYHQQKQANILPYLQPSENDPDNTLGQLQQQPLALGFYISTAPTGKLPKWFWVSNPEAEFHQPTTLKAALHITCSMNDTPVSHPLDSHQTTAVLRHVLENYNSLSWLNVDPSCSDRRSCLPIHMVVLNNMYHCFEKFANIGSS